MEERPILPFASPDLWAAWLAEHHGDTPAGVWLKIAKKPSGIATVTYAEALEEALCFGWIDGQKRGFDQSWFLQGFTPRRPRSRWSKVNTDKARTLIEQGRMRPAGLREVEAAQADGRWDKAYESQALARVPPDLQAAFDAHPQAAAFFATLNGANRYAVLYRIHDAKRPQTRADRIAKFVAMLERGETVHPRDNGS